MYIQQIFLVYLASCVTGAVLTQLVGNAGRPFHEGMLAWLFLPLGIIACLSAMVSEGIKGVKTYLREFYGTLLNHRPANKQGADGIIH